MNTAAAQAQGLEGSRFVRWQLYGMAATESLRGRQAAPESDPRFTLVADVGALHGNDPCQTLD
jgi:hypothetical protein